MDVNKIAHIAVEAGKIILENGGETYRVEETIVRILKAFGFKDADSFVTPTGIMVSVTDKYGNTTSIVKRVKTRTVNLEKIAQVNNLSRNVASFGYTADEVKEELLKINSLQRYSLPVTLLFSSLAAGFFSLLFGGDFRDFLAASVIGSLIKYVTLYLGRLNISDFFITVSGGAIAALLAIISVSLNISHNLDMVIIGSIMLLVPGLAITNAIRDTIAGDLVAGTTRAVEAFLIALGVAIGTGIVLKIWLTLTGGIS